MSTIEGLLSAYEGFVKLPWESPLPGPRKVWFAIYDPEDERRLRFRFDLFEIATKNAGHGWRLVDLTDAFAHWMAQHEYQEAYFEQPEAMDLELEEFARYAADHVATALNDPGADDKTVVALSGAAALFGLTRISILIEAVSPNIKGRLLVFFPGSHEGPSYRLLNARDGWSYLAVPITADQGG